MSQEDRTLGKRAVLRLSESPWRGPGLGVRIRAGSTNPRAGPGQQRDARDGAPRTPGPTAPRESVPPSRSAGRESGSAPGPGVAADPPPQPAGGRACALWRAARRDAARLCRAAGRPADKVA